MENYHTCQKKKWGNSNQNDIKINALKQAQKSHLFTSKDIKPSSGEIEHVSQWLQKMGEGSNSGTGLKLCWMREAGIEEGKTSRAQTSTVYWMHSPLMFWSLFQINLISYLLPVSVYRCVNVCGGTLRGQKRVSENLALELEAVFRVDFIFLQKQQALSTAELTCPAPKALTRWCQYLNFFEFVFPVSVFSWFSVIWTYLLACWEGFKVVCRKTFILKFWILVISDSQLWAEGNLQVKEEIGITLCWS